MKEYTLKQTPTKKATLSDHSGSIVYQSNELSKNKLTPYRAA